MLLIAQFLICLGTALQGQCVGEGPSIIWGNPPTTNHPQKLSLSSCKKIHIYLTQRHTLPHTFQM